MFDVCIIGAGSIGSSAAYHLTHESQLKVCLVGPGEPSEKTTDVEVFGCHYDEGRITRVIAELETEQILALRSTLKYEQLELESGLKIFKEVGFADVGHRNDEKLEVTNKLSDIFCEKNGIDFEVFDESLASLKFSYFVPPKGCTGRYVKENNGYISIRNLVNACQKVFSQNGAVRFNSIAKSVVKSKGGFEISLGDGTVIHSRKMILTCGSFTNYFDLCQGKKPDLNLNGHTVLKFEISNDDYNKMAELPSMIYRFENGTYVYILPPIAYPCGKKYIKFGHSVYLDDPLAERLQSLQDVKDWYCKSDHPEARKHLSQKFSEIFPSVNVLSQQLDHCVMAMTATGRQYIGFVQEDVFLACGGNGKTAKMALEIGYICAKSIVAGKWDYDLNEADFRIVYRKD